MKTVLVLCTANSARSILGEAILNRVGAGRFRAFSAGSHPRGEPNPLAIETLQALGYETADLRSKSWDEFAKPGAPKIDIAITVCDSAAGEVCPLYVGAPIKAHWGIPDPAGVPGGQIAERDAFLLAYDRLHKRMSALKALPIELMSVDELRIELGKIGTMEGATDLTRQGADEAK